jgi:hypothetical protein
LRRDRKFQRTHRLVAACLFPFAPQLLARDRPWCNSWCARMMAVIELLQRCSFPVRAQTMVYRLAR